MGGGNKTGGGGGASQVLTLKNRVGERENVSAMLKGEEGTKGFEVELLKAGHLLKEVTNIVPTH